MASIITATTTSGLTQSADNSGVLQLASGTGNLVTIPSVTGTAMVSGNMPAFNAYVGSAFSVVLVLLQKFNLIQRILILQIVLTLQLTNLHQMLLDIINLICICF